MNIIYVSSATSRNVFKQLCELNCSITSEAVQKYNNLLMQGLASCEEVKVNAVTVLPLTAASRNSSKKVSINNDVAIDVNYSYISCINTRLLKHCSIFFNTFKELKKSKSKNDSNVIICDVLNLSSFVATYLYSKIHKIKMIALVTDLPQLLPTTGKIAKSIYRRTLNNMDGYFLLTEEMSKVVNNKNKPYIVIEGIVDCNQKETQIDKKINACMYTGGIRKKYGIETLVKGFLKADIANMELHLYGFGDYTKELEEISKENSSIKFFGTVLNEEIVVKQKQVKLLINPRPTTEEFTKYSFPSKNLEYMVSGTPVLTTKLPGMPIEYNDYVYLLEDESEDGIAETLKTILSKSDKSLQKFGEESKNFVLINKNNHVIGNKILSWLNDKIIK